MKKFHVFLFSFFLFTQLKAQYLNTDQTGNYADVEYMINNVLIDPAVSAQMNVSNIKLNGVPVVSGIPSTNLEIGYFTEFASIGVTAPPAVGFAGFESGLFMSTGEVIAMIDSIATPTPTSNDTDDHLANQLEEVGSTASLNNLTVIEFDFVAAGSSVSFDYIFASEEYAGYTCSPFNDIFGFFISGPGIDDLIASTGSPNLGFQSINGLPYPVYNMAKVPSQVTPGTFTNVPVVINSINSGAATGSYSNDTCLVVNPNFVADNVFFVANPDAPVTSNIGFNGHTTTLTALANIQCGETYHMKLAIADVSDGSLNSAVLLKEGSFTIASGETDVSSDFNQSDSIIIEGCYPGTVTVKINEINPLVPTDILVSVSGSAVEGVDIDPVVDTLIIPPGDSTGDIIVTALADAILEGNESVIITTKVCASIISTDTLWIADPEQIFVSIPEDTIVCANSPNGIAISATPNGGYEPFSFQWFYNGVLEAVGPSVSIQPNLVGEHICVVTGDCGYTASDTFVVNHLPLAPEATFTSFFNLETDQIIEGCEYGSLTFTLPSVFDHDTTLDFSIVGGDAIPGVDFYNLPTSITIPSGDLTGSINIEAIVDGEFEGDETIQIYFPFYDECTTFPNPLTLTIISNPLVSSALEDSIFICEGEDFTAESQVIGGIEPYQYTWTNGTGGIWSSEDLTLTGNTTTTYYLSLKDACEYEYEDSVVVVVPNYDPIEISSTFSNTIVMCKDDDLHLDVDITGGTETYVYEWRKDNIPISGEEILVVQDQDVSENDYVLTVTDECGSSAVKEFTIRVEHCEVPNVFTPNGDGLNDQFYFKSKDVEVNIRIRILDRWGNLVYRNENYEHCNLGGIECWNGKDYISDKECQEGIYFYVIEYNDGRLLKGTFHLMR